MDEVLSDVVPGHWVLGLLPYRLQCSVGDPQQWVLTPAVCLKRGSVEALAAATTSAQSSTGSRNVCGCQHFT